LSNKGGVERTVEAPEPESGGEIRWGQEVGSGVYQDGRANVGVGGRLV